ncbi:putative NADPH-quinone reductase [Mucilaginibacter sp. UYP25]|uniref:NAD(P)H-dependent oxidoreductase n=1 Tax=unclassified Mucilaginibacter TaxID=2617802 RepID=UPI003390CCD6
MKHVVIINADVNKGETTQALINAYRHGAEGGQASVKDIVIADLKFNPNKQLPGSIGGLEADLTDAVVKLMWASHIVVFCPVFKDSINFKIKGFFDRIFMPDQVFVVNQPKFSNDFRGRSARIVSILDEAAWADWQETQRATYLSIKRSVLEKCNIKPVHTSAIGHIYSLENQYAQKWLKKLYSFGIKLI